MNRTGNILLVGPFSEIRERVAEFSSGMFASLMMLESISRLEAAELEHKIACDGEDEAKRQETERTLRACETTVQITIALLDGGSDGEEMSQ